jgi:hypothetical protein
VAPERCLGTVWADAAPSRTATFLFRRAPRALGQPFRAESYVISIQRCRAFDHLGVLFAVAMIWCALAEPCLAVKPASPEVRKLIDKGVIFLEKDDESRFGGRCLVAMTLLKTGKSVEHPKVYAAIAECEKMAKESAVDKNTEDIYALGVATLFLCELDVSKYGDEINYFLNVLKHRQKSHGGWGYEGQGTGDTSMTQYGVLSAWTAKQLGLSVADEVIEKVANWLIRTQDPSGGWGYQGVDPGSYEKVAQSEVRLSLTTAALGSTLIAANLLGIIDMEDSGDELPPALVLVPEERPGDEKIKVEGHRLREAVSTGTGWFRKNYTISPDGFTHYYLYALERFMSFKELADGKKIDEATWYNEGYKYLSETQKEDGSWISSGGAQVDTAFSILFLLRSTRKAIEKVQSFGEGTLVGGRGLPKDTANVKLRGGRLVAQNQTQAVDEMIKALGDPDDPELDFMAENPDKVELSKDEKVRIGQLKQLRQVVRTGAPKARLAAVKALGQSRDVQYVPLLIYAITDPDPQVCVAADQALRFMTRRFHGQTLKVPPDPASQDAAVAQWKEWFMKIYPDMALEEQ